MNGYDISFNIQFWGVYFRVPIVYYYLVISISNWWKIRHYSSKSLSWWYIHAHPECCKIIHQVSVQILVCVCISITSCKNKIVHFRGSDMDIKVHCTLFPLWSVFVPLGFFNLRFLTRQCKHVQLGFTIMVRLKESVMKILHIQ